MREAGRREGNGGEYSKNIHVWKYQHEANYQHNQDQLVKGTPSEYVLPLIQQDNNLNNAIF